MIEHSIFNFKNFGLVGKRATSKISFSWQLVLPKQFLPLRKYSIMKKIQLFFFFSLLFLLACGTAKEEKNQTVQKGSESQTAAPYAIAIHGGAGTILKENITEEKEKAIRAVLDQALEVGRKILEEGGASMDAVEQTIMILENSPHFNAAKGAVFNYDGKNEMDASFMEGKTQNAGAIGGVSNIKNPIRLARAVLEKSNHVLLTGKGAETFATEVGIETVDPTYFYTKDRWESLQRAKDKEAKSGLKFEEEEDFKYGTVGCAALDRQGNLSAGTSTGGMTNKRYNRIGDSPVIGAGTYANNATCAISSTGHGEYFMRYVVAYDIHARMAYGEESFREAANMVIMKTLKEKGGTGGIIGVDKYGNVAMPFNTPGMYRGYAKPKEKKIFIYGGEE